MRDMALVLFFPMTSEKNSNIFYVSPLRLLARLILVDSLVIGQRSLVELKTTHPLLRTTGTE